MIDTFSNHDKLYTKLANLKPWDKNPRSIKELDFERLKKQILKLSQYKPNLVTDDGTVLGGNMRTRAYQYILKEYKTDGVDAMSKRYGLPKDRIEEVVADIERGIWISVVDAKTDAEKMEYALSDNDRAGFYDDDMLANIMPEFEDVDWSNYAIDLHPPIPIDESLYTEDGLTDGFTLPEGEKGNFQQVAFVLADKQAEIIKQALAVAKEKVDYQNVQKMGNENSNGNALYMIVRQWLQQNSTS